MKTAVLTDSTAYIPDHLIEEKIFMLRHLA